MAIDISFAFFFFCCAMLCSFVRSSRLSADALGVYVLDHLFPFSSLLVDAVMWLLLIWSWVLNVVKSDRYATPCTDISASLFRCAKVWSLKGWVFLNAEALVLSKGVECQTSDPVFHHDPAVFRIWHSSFIEWLLYLPGISIVFRNSGFRRHSMFWCCSVLYICDRKCLKCEIKFQMKRASTKCRWEILCI